MPTEPATPAATTSTTDPATDPATGRATAPVTGPAATLRAAGLRVTGQRVAVLASLDDALDAALHLTAAEVAAAARARMGGISTQAVYDCLDALTEAGLVRRIEPAGRPALYEARVGDNHHHLVCRGCGSTVDVDCTHGAAPCLTPDTDHGFVVDEAEVVFWGTCPSCVARRGAAPSSAGRARGGPAGATPRASGQPEATPALAHH